MTAHAPTASEPRKEIQPHGGALVRQTPFVATDEQRQRVRGLAKSFPVNGERHIAVLMGICRETLRQHFQHELEYGRAEMLAAVGSQFVSRALDVDQLGADGTKIAKGDLDAQKYVLARLGGWTTKVEHSGPEGGPIETRTFDLNGLGVEQLEAMLPVLEQILSSAGAEDAEFSEVDEEGKSDATPDAD